MGQNVLEKMMTNSFKSMRLKLFQQIMEDELSEETFKVLLEVMNAAFMIDTKLKILDGYYDNIKHWTGTFQFRSINGNVDIYLKMSPKGMDIQERLVDNADVTVMFTDGKALMNYLLRFVREKEQDFLSALLNNEIRVMGNWNCLYKFAYLTNHLMLPFANL